MIKVEIVKSEFVIPHEKDFQKLHSKSFGQKLGKVFNLFIDEAAFLLEKGKIEIFKNEKKVSFKEICKLRDFNFSRYQVFKDLRTRGYVVKSGLKYGFPFRVYDKGIKVGQDHSLWLVDILEYGKSLKVSDYTSKNRVAHSTRKKILYAIVDSEKSIIYIENNWRKI